MMQAMRVGDDPEHARPPYAARDGEPPVRHAVMGEDVGRDVERGADPEPCEHGTAERDERRGCPERPEPEQVVPDDAARRRTRVMRFVLAPERAVEDEAMDERHPRLGEYDRHECDEQRRHERSGTRSGTRRQGSSRGDAEGRPRSRKYLDAPAFAA